MRHPVLLLLLAVALAACEGIDCSLNNVVLLRAGLYKSGTDSLITLADTLTVTAAGTDSVLLNRQTHAHELTLPLSFWAPADTFRLHLYGEGYQVDDYIVVEKSNTIHYESPDCPVAMFHQISAVSHHSPLATIDSVRLVRPAVDYQPDENLRIYYHLAADPQ